jgi:O-antigen/teichoic acid export membrane protein
LLILPPTLLVLALIATPMLHGLYHDYSPNAVPLVLLLGAGSVIATLSFVITRGLFSSGRGDLDVWANVVPLVVLLTAGWPLTMRYGAIGAAVSLLAAQVLCALVRLAMFWKVAGADPLPARTEAAPQPVLADAAV